jgi:hypothetical protein
MPGAVCMLRNMKIHAPGMPWEIPPEVCLSQTSNGDMYDMCARRTGHNHLIHGKRSRSLEHRRADRRIEVLLQKLDGFCSD